MSTKALTEDFTFGNIPRRLLVFALPFMVSNVLQVLCSTIDRIVAGEYAGPPACPLFHKAA